MRYRIKVDIAVRLNNLLWIWWSAADIWATVGMVTTKTLRRRGTLAASKFFDAEHLFGKFHRISDETFRV